MMVVVLITKTSVVSKPVLRFHQLPSECERSLPDGRGAHQDMGPFYFMSYRKRDVIGGLCSTRRQTHTATVGVGTHVVPCPRVCVRRRDARQVPLRGYTCLVSSYDL